MILDLLEGSVIFEQYGEDTGTEQAPVDQVDPGDPPEFIHLKKHYLLDRLRNLQSRLDSQNIPNDELETIIQFGNELSYDTLVRLATDVAEIINLQLSKEVKTNDRQKKTASV